MLLHLVGVFSLWGCGGCNSVMAVSVGFIDVYLQGITAAVPTSCGCYCCCCGEFALAPVCCCCFATAAAVSCLLSFAACALMAGVVVGVAVIVGIDVVVVVATVAVRVPLPPLLMRATAAVALSFVCTVITSFAAAVVAVKHCDHQLG